MIKMLSFISGETEKPIHFQIAMIIVRMDLDILLAVLLTEKETFMDLQYLSTLEVCYKHFNGLRSRALKTDPVPGNNG